MSSVIKRFYGINSAQPAIVQGAAGDYTFQRPVAFGVFASTTPGASYGNIAMPGQLLDLPGDGILNGQPWKLTASGHVSCPAGTTGGSLNITLNQNTFKFSQQKNPDPPFYTTDQNGPSSIAATSTKICSGSPVSLVENTSVNWLLKVAFEGDGSIEEVGVSGYPTSVSGTYKGQIVAPNYEVTTGSTLLTGLFELTIGNTTVGPSATNVLTNFNAFSADPPPAQLSVVASLAGALSGSNLFQVSMEQFQIEV